MSENKYILRRFTMQTFGALIVSLVLATCGVTALPQGGQTASVKAIYNPDFKPNLATSLVKAYKKHNIPVPPRVSAAAGRHLAKRDGGAPAHSIDGDSEYLVPVDIGTPAQRLNLDFDTGSSDLWVFSSELPKAEVKGQSIYNPSKSSTAQKYSGETWDISYLDHTGASGDVYWDKVAVGPVSFAKQGVETAQKVTAGFTNDTNNDGLLGLAFDDGNTASPRQVKTWFTNVKAGLKNELFTANLNHKADGTYNFGDIDSSEHTGSVTYTDLDSSEGFWGFTSTGYAVGDAKFKSKSITGIADTGTTLMLLPADVAKAYYAQVKTAVNSDDEGGYVFDCDASLPDFTYGVESSKIRVPGNFLNFGPTDDDPSLCVGGIQDGGSDIIFGDMALKAALVVFDAGNSRLGFAPKKTT